MQKRAVIAGATGLVGEQLLTLLLELGYYEKIYILSRRQVEYTDPRVEVVVVNYNRLNTYRDKFSGHHYYCCLGTTIKAAKSMLNFARVDYLYAYRLAFAAELDSMCSQFVLLTSMGANPDSAIFYSRVKGQVESEVSKLNIGGIHFIRPSILLGKRKKPRLYEELGRAVSMLTKFILIGSPQANFIAIRARIVAQAMFYIATSERNGTHTYSPYKITKISQHKKVA